MPLHRGWPWSLRHSGSSVVAALMVVGLAPAPGASAHAIARSLGVIDASCRGGAGTVVSAPRSWMGGGPSVAVTMLPRGVTLVVVSSLVTPASFAVVHAFMPNCAPDPAFGTAGVEQLAFGGRNFSIAAAVPASGGGALLVGQTAKGWLVARIEANGQLDPGFGKGGSTVLGWPGGASAVAQTPSGNVLLGGSVGGGCCEEEWVGELSEQGAVVEHFGSGGRARIPVTMDDSSLTRVAVEPDGQVLVLTLGGNMGIWGTSVNAFTPGGLPVPSFQKNFEGAIRRASPQQIYVGDLVVDRDGFLLVGTGQTGPFVNATSPTAAGHIVAFRLNGSLATGVAERGEVRFSSPLLDPVWALPQLDREIVMVGMRPWSELGPRTRAALHLVDISEDGKVNREYGRDGTSEFQLPFLARSFPADSIPVSVATNGRVIVVVSSTEDGKALKLVQLRE